MSGVVPSLPEWLWELIDDYDCGACSHRDDGTCCHVSYTEEAAKLTAALAAAEARAERAGAAFDELARKTVWVKNRDGDVFCDYCGAPQDAPEPGQTSLGPCDICAVVRAALADAPAAGPEAGGG